MRFFSEHPLISAMSNYLKVGHSWLRWCHWLDNGNSLNGCPHTEAVLILYNDTHSLCFFLPQFWLMIRVPFIIIIWKPAQALLCYNVEPFSFALFFFTWIIIALEFSIFFKQHLSTFYPILSTFRSTSSERGKILC